MTQEEMLSLLKTREQVARASLLEEGHVVPMVDFVCPVEGLQERAEKMGLNIQRVCGDDAPMFSVVSMFSTLHPETLLNAFFAASKPGGRDHLETMREVGIRSAGLTVDGVNESILKVLCQQQRCLPQDLWAFTVHQLAKKLEACAVLKVDESWMLPLQGVDRQSIAEERSSHPANLADDPASVEVATLYFESRLVKKMLIIPINRERPHDESSRIVSLGETQGWDQDEVSSLEGRYVDFLQGAVQ